MQYQTPKIIQPGRWKRHLWLILSLSLVLVVLIYVGWRNYYQEWGLKALQVLPLQTKLKRAHESIEALEAEQLSLQEKMATLIRQNQLDQKAMQQTQASLQQRQLDCLKMEEELVFLRHVVSPDKANSGLQVHKISLKPTAKLQEYLYKFTVSQGLNKSGNAIGWIHLSVEGESRAGKKVVLNLQEITKDKTNKIKMNFKHFQDVAGAIRLPDDFMPKKLTIEIRPSKKRQSRVKKTLDWSLTG